MRLLFPLFFIFNLVDLSASPWSEDDYHSFFKGKKKVELKKIENNLSLLKKSKYFLLNGEISKAEYFLGLINDPQKELSNIVDRYRSLIFFILDKNNKSYEASPALSDRYFKQLCLMKLNNELILEKKDTLGLTYSKCEFSLSSNSVNNSFWFEKIVSLFSKDTRELDKSDISKIKNLINDNKIVRLWLKLALYLGQEKDLKKSLEFIPESAYTSKSIRELMGLMYFRLGDNELAMKFVDKLSTANAENIKGNVRLKENKYELALGHFKLALKKKANSINALERAIPITWILGDFSNGHDLINRVVDFDIDEKKVLILKAVFLSQTGQYEKARQFIRALEKLYPENLPQLAHEAKAFLDIKLEDPINAKDSLEFLCRAYSGLSCYLANTYLHFEDFHKLENDESFFKKDHSVTKSLQDINPEPMLEKAHVDQRYIEELDRDEFPLKILNQNPI